jgi:hypothetical protein
MLYKMPAHLLLFNDAISQLNDGVIRGENLRAGMDIPIKGYFPKTKLGRFATGWKNKSYSRVKHIEDLNPEQRKDLAGAYWISPQNCNRYPMPMDLVRFSSKLFVEGIRADGAIPYAYEGKQLNLNTILSSTQIKLAGFYGKQDKLVPQTTGSVLQDIFQKRYTHVVHEQAGHISYVLSPKSYENVNPRAFKPNPIDLVSSLMDNG